MFVTVKQASGPLSRLSELTAALGECERYNKLALPLSAVDIDLAVRECDDGATSHIWLIAGLAIRFEWRVTDEGYTLALSSERLTTHGKPPKHFLKKSRLPRFSRLTPA